MSDLQQAQNARMTITKENALNILVLLEDWYRVQTIKSQRNDTLHQDSFGNKVFHSILHLPSTSSITHSKESYTYLYFIIKNFY